MNKIVSTIIFFSLAATAQAQTAGEATIRLTGTTLMHEMRATPSPLDGAEISDRAVSFNGRCRQASTSCEADWTVRKKNTPKKETDKSKLRYFLRYSQTPAFKPETTVQAETRWPFFNPKQDLAPGTWYWQYGYVTDGKTEWSDTLQFTVKNNPRKFCPPALDAVLKNLPAHHPPRMARQRRMGRFHKAQ